MFLAELWMCEQLVCVCLLHRVDEQSSKVPSGQSEQQQHQTQLDSIFQVCECTSTAVTNDNRHKVKSAAAF